MRAPQTLSETALAGPRKGGLGSTGRYLRFIEHLGGGRF